MLFTIEGQRVFAGANTNAPLAYTVKNNRVYRGTEKGPVLYNFVGDRMFRGPNSNSELVFQANTDLVGELQILAVILAEQQQ